MPYTGVTNYRSITIQTMLDPLNAPKMKQHFESDSDGDPTSISYAQSAAVSGEECLQQVFEYTTVSGNKVNSNIGWKTGVWGDTTWDIT